LLLPAVREALEELETDWEIIIADGGSSDGTVEAATIRGARVVPQTERGFGGAILAGFAATEANYVVTMDADLSHRPVFLQEFWKHRDEAEVIIASRYVRGGRSDTNLFRRLLSHILNRTYARLLSIPVRDLSSNFRMYRREVLTALRLVARDFDILEEILIRIFAQGWRIREVPFHYTSRGSGHSHARLLAFGWAFLKTLVRMWHLRNSVESADYDHRAFDSPIPLQRYWQRTRHRIILDYVRAAGSAKGESTLDIGCGSSRIIQDLPLAVGLDRAFPKVRFLRPLHAYLMQGSLFALPFASGAFDTVVCSEVIEHLPDTPSPLAEMSRVLRPGGILILGTPDYGRTLWRVLEWIYGKVLPGAYAKEHITHYTRAGLQEKLATAGYQVVEVRYVGGCEMIFRATKKTVLGPFAD